MQDLKFIAGQKEIIEKEIARLEKDIVKSRKYEEVGSTNEDSALEFESFEEKLALLKNSKKELTEYKSALEQIENGKYGICQKCGEMIEKGRLKAYPAAKLCATDAQRK